MKVYLVIVLAAVIAGNKTFILVGVACHNTGSNSLLYFVIKLGNGANALGLAILACPYGKRGTPVTAAAQVPVVQILEPLAKTACTCGFGFPSDGFVEFAHTLFHMRCTYKPAIERIVKHGLVGAPAVGIVVNVFLNLEHLVLLFQRYAKNNVQCFGLCSRLLVETAIYGICRVVGVFHIGAGIFRILLNVHAVLHKHLIEFVYCPEFSCKIHHRTGFALLVHHKERGDACGLCHKSVIGTECGSYVNDTCTILGGHIVAGDYAETVVRHLYLVTLFHHGFHPGEQLLVMHTHKVGTLVLGNNLVRNHLVALLVAVEGQFGTRSVKVGVQKSLCHNNGDGLARVAVVRTHSNVIYLGAHTKCGVRRQCPRSGCPGKEIGSTPPCHFGFGVEHTELRHSCCILDIAVATGLVKLV